MNSTQSVFPGKRIILDIWSTTCGPCIAAIESAAGKTKKRELKIDDVEVIYVCLDSPIEDWKKLVNKMNAKGIHVFLDEK